MERRVHLVTIVNGPGELSGWMLPVVRRFKARSPSSTVSAVITPCQFASGRERATAAADGSVDQVWSFREFAARHLGGAWRAERASPGPTVILHFGGDRLYVRFVARALGAPVWRYGTSGRGWHFAERFLVPDERHVSKLVRQGIDARRVHVVGQLVVDSVRHAERLPSDGPAEAGAASQSHVLLLPGSRMSEVHHMVPFYAAVMDHVARVRPATTFAMSRAPFIGPQAFAEVAGLAGCQVGGGVGDEWIETSQHVRSRIVAGDWAQGAAEGMVAVCLPGTNTLQLGALGVPMVVVLPLNWGEHVPLEGLAGLLLPVAMPFGLVKRYLTRAMNRWVTYIALPNILASDAVVPELRGVLRESDVARAVVDLLDDPARRAAMSVRLREIAGPPGAADRIVDMLLGRSEARCASGS